jgi:hypothetical protein
MNYCSLIRIEKLFRNETGGIPLWQKKKKKKIEITILMLPICCQSAPD